MKPFLSCCKRSTDETIRSEIGEGAEEREVERGEKRKERREGEKRGDEDSCIFVASCFSLPGFQRRLVLSSANATARRPRVGDL